MSFLHSHTQKKLTQECSHEPFCRQCFRRASQLRSREKLKACDTCRLKFHCSSCGSQDHALECEKLQLFRQDQLFLIHSVKKKALVPVLTTEDPLDVFEPISKLAGWYDY